MSYEYVHGVEEELKKLLDFPVQVEKKIVRGAVRAAAQVVRKAAMLRAPVGAGISHKGASASLRDTIRVSTGIRGKIVKAAVRVGDRKKGVFYAHMVIGGTKPHIIKARVHGALGFGGIVRQVVQHPGARAQPFLAEADAASRDEALRSAFDYADQHLRAIIVAQGNKP